jgi:hypothetical protein
MKHSSPQSITSLTESPEDERKKRMLQYTIAMTIRMVCVILIFFVHDWWAVIPVIGAIVLPYVAVVVANTAVRKQQPAVAGPGVIALYRSPDEP